MIKINFLSEWRTKLLLLNEISQKRYYGIDFPNGIQHYKSYFFIITLPIIKNKIYLCAPIQKS
jgi:hypothetical protein